MFKVNMLNQKYISSEFDHSLFLQQKMFHEVRIAMDIILFTQNCWRCFSIPNSFNIRMKVWHSLLNTPRELIDKFINFTEENAFLFSFHSKHLYFSFFRLTLFERFDSYQKVDVFSYPGLRYICNGEIPQEF